MKKILLALSIIYFFACDVCAENLVITNDININDTTKFAKISQYNCTFNKIQCSVDKVKLLQTGKIFYETDCDCSKLQQKVYKNRAKSDVKYNRFEYCKLVNKVISN